MSEPADRSPSAQLPIRRVREAQALPDAIQWQEGMLLAPEHFQQLTLRQEELLAYHGGMLSPWGWGVRRLQLDPDLAKGAIRVADLEALMPDGLVAALDPSASALQVDLNPLKENLDNRPTPLWVVTRSRRAGSSSVAGSAARFRALEGEPVNDENTGEGERRIRRLRPRLSLVVAQKPAPDQVGLPLARIQYRDGQFRLIDYEPPRLAVPQDSPLGVICDAISDLLRGKARTLQQSRLAHRPATRLETRMKIQGLVAGLPLLEALLGSDNSHPRSLYLALCGIAGSLAVLRQDEQVPLDLPAYDHENLLDVFRRAHHMIREVVTREVSEDFTDYVFELEPQKGIFYLHFEKPWKERQLVIGLRRSSAMDEQALNQWMEQAIIGSQSHVTAMQKNRVLGIARGPVDSQGDLATTSAICLYSLKEESKFLNPDERLLVFNPRGGPRPAEVILYVRNRPGDG